MHRFAKTSHCWLVPALQAMRAVSKVPGEAKLVDAAIHHTKCALQFAGRKAAWQRGLLPFLGECSHFPVSCQPTATADYAVLLLDVSRGRRVMGGTALEHALEPANTAQTAAAAGAATLLSPMHT